MAELEKLDDGSLDEVSGGVKYNIGPQPVYVYDNSGKLRHVLYQGDYLVTDGQYGMGGRYAHVYYYGGDGWVDASIL